MFSELVKASNTFNLIPLELVDGRWICLSDRTYKLVRSRECDYPQTRFFEWNKEINPILTNPPSATLTILFTSEIFTVLVKFLSLLIIFWANRAGTYEENQWQKKHSLGSSSIPAFFFFPSEREFSIKFQICRHAL